MLWTVVILPSLITAAPLDEYVYTTDPYYHFTEISATKGPGYTLYLYNMTSLKWKSETFSDHSIWWHTLEITIPDKLIHKDTALMLIGGGHNSEKQFTNDNGFETNTTTSIALSTGSICGNLGMIPNQPIVFKADPEQISRTEDQVVAWTWEQFVRKNGTDPEILVEFPMTKASVRALDTIAAVAMDKANVDVNKFFLFGASKRGWASWLTAAVDKRVVGFAPVVMDLLNFVKNLHHHYRSLGGWTFAFDAYYQVKFTADLDNPSTQKMATYIDPLAYSDRYTSVPKMIITTAGDEFFLPDDSHYYYDQLDGPKYLRIVPNAEHSLVGHRVDIIYSLEAFYLSILTNTERPKLYWTRELTSSGGRITLHTNIKPKTVEAKFAVTLDNKRRDFRMFVATPGDPSKGCPHPVVWFSDSVKNVGNNTFVAEFEDPILGRWLAFYIEVTFEGLNGFTQKYTTEAQIIPDVFPFPDCHGKGCLGTLV